MMHEKLLAGTGSPALAKIARMSRRAPVTPERAAVSELTADFNASVSGPMPGNAVRSEMISIGFEASAANKIAGKQTIAQRRRNRRIALLSALAAAHRAID